MKIEKVMQKGCEYFGIQIEELKDRKKTRPLSDARHMIMKIAVVRTSESKVAIGLKFNRDHSTIIHAEKVVNNLCKTDDNFRETFEELNEFIGK